MIDINDPNNHVPDQQTNGGGWTTPFSRWLAQQREKAGLTHEQVAGVLGITVDGYRLYEVSRGSQHTPSRVKYKHFTGLSKVLGIDRDTLMRLCGLIPPVSLQELAQRREQNLKSSKLRLLRNQVTGLVESLEHIIVTIKELEDEDRRTQRGIRPAD